MKTIFIGTSNLGKVNDFKHILSAEGIEVKSLHDLNEEIEIEESGATFEENAKLKAETLCQMLNQIVIADDSGLEIKALQGKPGVYSARYAGEHKNDEDNIQKVLSEMKGIPFEKREAAFVCVLAVAIPGKETLVLEGRCNGYIAQEPKGEHGFGYDPIFYVPDKGKTMAEMSPDEKNEISHRRRALNKLKQKATYLF